MKRVDFSSSLIEKFRHLAEKEVFVGRDGCLVHVYFFETRDPLMEKLARSVRNPFGRENRADLVIQKNPVSGFVQVFPRQERHLPMMDLAGVLRIEEQIIDLIATEFRNMGHRIGEGIPGKLLSEAFLVTDWEDLRQKEVPERIPDCVPQWFLNPGDPHFILNVGSVSTRLRMEDMLSCARVAFSVDSLPPGFAENCIRGKCLASKENPCPFWLYGFSFCRRARFIRYQDQESREKSSVS